jgi:hypothetical protein
MTDQSRAQFPIAYSFEGGPSADGTAMLVQAIGFDGSATRFAIPIDNVKHFIAFLLVWVGTISAGQQDDDETGGDETGGDETRVAAGSTLPIPATSIAIGEPNGNEGFIGISVGRAELLFSLPVSAFAPIGQTLLLASKPTTASPS